MKRLPAPSGERLQVFELYSGVASIHKAAVRVGKTSTTFDKEADKRQDVLTKEGFQMALNSVLRIENDGLFTCAPKCGSFITACAANHKRTEANNFMGDLDREFVRDGNNIATTTAFLSLACVQICALFPLWALSSSLSLECAQLVHSAWPECIFM